MILTDKFEFNAHTLFLTHSIINIKMDKAGRETDHHNEEGKLAKKIKNFIYHPSELIGSGFSSQVFKGINELQSDPSKKNIAIKVIQLSKITNEVENYLLNNQVNALKLLKHPNILQTVDILMTKNNVYIVTQFCEGGDLLKHIKSNGPFTEVKAMSIIKDIVQGYKYIEENNIIHRDLKTSNIFLCKGRAKIADFGFCEFLGQKKPNVAYNVGSPAYMSPESYKQNQYSHKSDIWGIGIILYELLVGETPDRTLTYMEMVTNLMNGHIKNINNEEIKRILVLCFKKNLRQRIDSIGLAELVSIQLNRLQAFSQVADVAQQQKTPSLPPRNVSPTKGSSKQIKFFKAQIPKVPLVPNGNANRGSANNTGENNQNSGRKSITKQRLNEKQNLLKPHSEYLLFLYRLLKFIGQLKNDKVFQFLLPLFRHRSLLQSLAEQLWQQSQDQQQFYKSFQYLKNKFDQTYLQLVKQPGSKQSIYKQKLDTFATMPLGQPQALQFYRKMIKDICGQCINMLDRGQIINNRSQMGVVVDYLIIQHQLLGLHIEGHSIVEIFNTSKLGQIVNQQPKKISQGHIDLLKIKYNTFLGSNQTISSNQRIQMANISKQSNSRQQIQAPNMNSNPVFGNQSQQVGPKMMNFAPMQQQIAQPGMIPLSQIKNGFVGPDMGGGLFSANLQYNNVINQIPIHQSIMMPK